MTTRSEAAEYEQWAGLNPAVAPPDPDEAHELEQQTALDTQGLHAYIFAETDHGTGDTWFYAYENENRTGFLCVKNDIVNCEKEATLRLKHKYDVPLFVKQIVVLP